MRLAVAFVFAAGLLAQDIRTVRVASGILNPTDIQHAGDGSGRLFFVQQNGLIRIFRDGAVVDPPFLDIRSKTVGEGERGLLGLAFAPGFAGKQRFYVNYTDLHGDTVIAQYRVSSNPDVADASSEIVLLKIDQPYDNHNGGCLRFGPDGYLYIGMGDGGSAGDPENRAQRGDTLLGKLLRIDVESDPGRVRIPPANPFVNRPGFRPEIWATGLRNPWRFSFDRATGDLWIADVGQDTYEEINFQAATSRGGENYGWNPTEGLHCFLADNCDTRAFTLPVAEYTHNDGCSVTGGYVYRGRQWPGLRGLYFYGDLCSTLIWALERQGSEWVSKRLLASNFNITAFGEDEAGELYVADAGSGTIHRVEGSRAPRFSAAAVVNAASFAPGLVPGSLATVFVAGVLDDPGVVSATALPLPTTLGGLSVALDGIPAPIQLIANRNGQEQINFQAPFDLAGRPSVSVVVARQGISSAAAAVPVLDVQPAVYTLDGSLSVVVHNADYTLATSTRPLEPGEFAFVYASGLGLVSNPPPPGNAAPSLARTLADVRLTLAGSLCEVQYAGLAPGLVGVYQVNFRVPQNAPSGLQNLTITAGAESGPSTKVPVR